MTTEHHTKEPAMTVTTLARQPERLFVRIVPEGVPPQGRISSLTDNQASTHSYNRALARYVRCAELIGI